MAAKQKPLLKAAERRIADAVYERLSREIRTKISRGELILVEAKGSGKTPLTLARAPMLARAMEAFDSKQIATRWFQKPNPALKMKTPLEVVNSAPGRKKVEAILARIEQGVIS